MANSGIPWINAVFNWAVIALVECAKFLGITYEEINVWLFCVAWPLVTVGLMIWVVVLFRDNRVLRGHSCERSA